MRKDVVRVLSAMINQCGSELRLESNDLIEDNLTEKETLEKDVRKRRKVENEEVQEVGEMKWNLGLRIVCLTMKEEIQKARKTTKKVEKEQGIASERIEVFVGQVKV